MLEGCESDSRPRNPPTCGRDPTARRSGTSPSRRPSPVVASAGEYHGASEKETTVKIGVLGSGDVAKTLASGFLKHGHDTMMGTREPAKLKEWATEHPKGRVGSFGEAAKYGEAIILAVKGSAAADVLRAAGAAILSGKLVID